MRSSTSFSDQDSTRQYRNENSSGELTDSFNQHFNLSSSIRRSTTSLYNIGIKYFKPLQLKDYSGFFITKSHYGQANGETYINNSFFHLRLIQETNEKLVSIPEVFVQYESNSYALTTLRYLAGIGLRYEILNSTGGTSLINEWYKEDSNTSSENYWRISQYLNATFLINKMNKIDLTLYIQPSIFDLSNIRYYSELGYNSKINDYVSYKSTLTSKFYSNSSSFNDIELYFESGLDFKI